MKHALGHTYLYKQILNQLDFKNLVTTKGNQNEGWHYKWRIKKSLLPIPLVISKNYSDQIWKVGHYELSILRHIYKYIVTLFSESRTKYAFIVDSAIRPPPFWQKILWTTFVKKNLRCKYNILYLLQTSIIFINIVE